MKNCLTCKYWEFDALGPECGPCKYTTDGMTGWVAADKDKEEKTVKEQEKTLSEYSIEELKAEIEKRERDEEKKKHEEEKKWINSFVIGDYYKICHTNSPNAYVIVRADKVVTTAYGDMPYIKCTNVYDNCMGWISTPSISTHMKTSSLYTIKHLVNGYRAETM